MDEKVKKLITKTTIGFATLNAMDCLNYSEAEMDAYLKGVERTAELFNDFVGNLKELDDGEVVESINTMSLEQFNAFMESVLKDDKS